ncbi:MAG: PAS domain S-box protein [Deltaproteobacteria bacterium]|nr:PAS domain S-box protein [Deltaproteobacteria bacterium]
MKKPGKGSSFKYWLFFLLIIIVQLILARQVVVGVRESHLSEIEQVAERDIAFLSEIVREKLQNRDYLSADFFLKNWGKSHSHRIDKIILEMANGFILSHYQSPEPSRKSYTLSRDVPYSYRGQARLGVRVNLDSVCVHEVECVRNMALLMLFFSVALGLLLGLHLRQRKMAQALSNSENRYREIFNAPNDAILIHDAASGAILDVNRAMLEMFGYGYEAARQQTIVNLSARSSAETLAAVQLKFQKVREQGPQLFEWLSQKRDGQAFWTEVALKEWGFDGRNYIIAVIRDISRRKADEEILATERERLRVTLRSIGDGVMTTDIEGNVVLVNKVAEELSGWSQGEAVGRPLSEVFKLVNDKTGEIVPDPVQRVLDWQKGISLPEHTVLISRNGQRLSIADSAAPIYDRSSQMVGVVVVFRDVTERQKLEKELLKSRKLESVAVLAGGIAHDFNNILAAIMGNLSLALTMVQESAEVYEILQDAEKASLRASDLTQQLLTFAKGGEPVKQAAAIESVVRDSASFVLRGTSVRCDYKFAPDLELALIDAAQISQVIQNLVLNARQAMQSGGVIEIEARNYLQEAASEASLLTPGRYVEIVIKDQGCGIPVELIDKIFDPYFTTKAQGNGLGLAITHSIIRKHGGQIKVAPRSGGGSVFTIYLPTTAAPVMAEPAEVKLSERPPSGLRRILVMDDEAMLRDMVKQILSRFGYEVVLAADGNEALAIYRQARESGAGIDLVIMDLTIPGGMGGKEAMAALKEFDPQAKVIVSSGYSNDPIMAEFEAYGFAAAIVKPFRLADLQAVVARVLAG